MRTFSKISLMFVILFITGKSIAQVSINATGNAPNSKAMLDVSSTTKGLLMPRMVEHIFGKGGNAGNTAATGGNGGFKLKSLSSGAVLREAPSSLNRQPGGGGAAGNEGANEMAIIYW